MSFFIRFIISMLLLILIPYCSIGKDNQQINDQERIVLSDSFVRAQLKIADSLSLGNTVKADSILSYLLENQIPNKKLWEEAIDFKCITMKMLSRHQEAVDFLEELVKGGDSNPRLFVEIARSYTFLLDYSQAISNIQKAILIYTKEENFIGVAEAVQTLIEIYGELNMFDEAEIYFNNNIKLCNKINYNYGLIKAYQEYGEALTFENPDLAYELLLKAKHLAESSNEDRKCSVSIYLIRYYINSNQFQLAKSSVHEYLKICGKMNFLYDSNIYTLMAHIYSLEKDVDSTIYFNNKALESRILSGNTKMVTSSYLNLSGNYLAKGEIVKANEYLDKAEENVIDGSNKGMLLIYYRGKVKYFEFVKDFKNAYLFAQKEIKLNQEITNQNHQSMLSKLNSSFEIQQKNILLENELEQRKSRMRLLLLILSLGLFLLSIVYLIYILRKKNYYYLKLARKTTTIEQKLLISNKERLKLQSIFEFSVTGILILDKNGLIQYGNHKGLELLNKKEDTQVLQTSFAEFFKNNNKSKVQEALQNVFIKQQADQGIKVPLINQTDFHWLDISFAPLVFEQEEDTILVTLIDVTQEVINIGREQDQKKELQTLLNSVPESILFIQRNGKIKALNNTAASRIDPASEELNGANYFDIIPKPLLKKRTKMFNKVVRTKKPLIEVEIEGNHNNLVSMYPNINLEGEVDYISEFVQDITERRLAEQQIDNLKQRVFRSQMNPHFIFNSLTSIQSFVLRNDAIMASKYLNSFARLIRLILESSLHDYISLQNEIDILNYYLDIQKMRFSDNFKYSFVIDPTLDLDKIKIPPMLAQPFIENAIEHGIQHLDKLGELNLEFVKEGSRLLFEISDNGIGRVASETLNKDNVYASKSLSTKIINDRLDALNKYSKETISYNIIDLKDEHNESAGTQVVISIPIANF